MQEIISRIPESKRPVIIIICGILIIALIVIPELAGGNEKKKTQEKTDGEKEQSEYAADIEKRLSELISEIDGAGKTKVMLTMDSTEENVYARDINGEKNEYVILRDNSDEDGLLLKVIKPEIRGVAVVCEGGDNPVVKIQIINAISSSLGVSSARISIAKMKDRSD